MDHPQSALDSPPKARQTPTGDAELYRAAQQTLRIGFIIAAALFVAGFAALAIAGDDVAKSVTPIDEIPADLADGDPMAILDLAFLALMLTPIATVLRLALTFLRIGERRFAMISFVVLAILIVSVTVALLR